MVACLPGQIRHGLIPYRPHGRKTGSIPRRRRIACWGGDHPQNGLPVPNGQRLPLGRVGVMMVTGSVSSRSGYGPFSRSRTVATGRNSLSGFDGSGVKP